MYYKEDKINQVKSKGLSFFYHNTLENNTLLLKIAPKP